LPKRTKNNLINAAFRLGAALGYSLEDVKKYTEMSHKGASKPQGQY